VTYQSLGRSNLSVSRICLGTMHFGGVAEEAECRRIMDRALELGITFWDTANVYGMPAAHGMSEEIIGRWLAQGGGRRDSIVLATKVYGRMIDKDTPPNEGGGISSYKVRKHAADSLRRLQTDHIDLYQVHHIDRRIPLEEFWGTFEHLRQRGDILYTGTSNFPGWGLARFQMDAIHRGILGIVSEQAQYNLLNRWPELEIIPAARTFGIGIMAYMPLAGGLLTGKRTAPPGSRTATVEREYHRKLGEDAVLEEFSRLCAEMGEKEMTVALAWVLANPAVSSAIVGIRAAAQLDALEQAAQLHLEEAVLQRLGAIFDINKGRPLSAGPIPEAFAW
jgi:aryl-alcohol dehydrogenase-like predicted oxidoreductase